VIGVTHHRTRDTPRDVGVLLTEIRESPFFPRASAAERPIPNSFSHYVSLRFLSLLSRILIPVSHESDFTNHCDTPPTRTDRPVSSHTQQQNLRAIEPEERHSNRRNPKREGPCSHHNLYDTKRIRCARHSVGKKSHLCSKPLGAKAPPLGGEQTEHSDIALLTTANV
jgi:hypothetical protein